MAKTHPLSTSAEQFAQRRRLTTKMVGQEKEADICRFPSLHCFIICFFFVCVYPLCLASDQNFAAKIIAA